MTKVLFLYNDLNDVKGISTAMQVAERYAFNSDNGKFWVETRPKPVINFENGSSIAVRPVTQGLKNLEEFDEIYIDDSIDSIVDTKTNFNHDNVKFYNKSSFGGGSLFDGSDA